METSFPPGIAKIQTAGLKMRRECAALRQYLYEEE